jgi:hypothetical protein
MKVKTVLGMALLLALLGCSKLTLENYNKLQVGMSYDEVTQLIGPPEACDDVLGLRNCRWGDDKRSISVSFAADKALVFSAQNLH